VFLLAQELDLRKSELEKINTLEDKIKLELSSLNTKIETMQEELVTFTRLDLLKEKSIDKKHKLEVRNGGLLCP
jgi:intraflagellar transport protein 74